MTTHNMLTWAPRISADKVYVCIIYILAKFSQNTPVLSQDLKLNMKSDMVLQKPGTNIGFLWYYFQQISTSNIWFFKIGYCQNSDFFFIPIVINLHMSHFINNAIQIWWYLSIWCRFVCFRLFPSGGHRFTHMLRMDSCRDMCETFLYR